MRRKLTVLDVLREAQDAVVGKERSGETGAADRGAGAAADGKGAARGQKSRPGPVRPRQRGLAALDRIGTLRAWLGGKVLLSRALVLGAALAGLLLLWGAYGLGAGGTRAAPVELAGPEDGGMQENGDAQEGTAELPAKKAQMTPDLMNRDSTEDAGRVVPVERPSPAPEYRIADFFQINTVLNRSRPRRYCEALVEDLQAKGFRARMNFTDTSKKYLAVYVEIPEGADPDAYLQRIRRLDPPDKRKVTFDYGTVDGSQRVTGRTLVK
ncbi:MAG: hypothetical protein ACE5F1_16410 [Planctomycetota bacterium]